MNDSMHATITPLRTPHDVDSAAPEVDLPRIERAVREILLAIGEDPDRDGLVETPHRVARAYRDLFAGLREHAGTHLRRVFEHQGAAGDLVAVRDIEVFSMCEHHLLPFTGRASVVYLPRDGRVVGLSKVARTVDVFARRPQLQERLTADIADAFAGHLDARGVAVVVRAEHLCMKMRGVGKQRSRMVTTACRGVFETDAARRAEALALLG